MTVKEIVEEWLKEHGYDGLCNPDAECGCALDDLIPCEGACDLCQPAYKGAPTDYDGYIGAWMTTEKPEKGKT